MNPPGIKPITKLKFERAMKIKRDNPDMPLSTICRRVGISAAWFKEIEKRLKEEKA